MLGLALHPLSHRVAGGVHSQALQYRVEPRFDVLVAENAVFKTPAPLQAIHELLAEMKKGRGL